MRILLTGANGQLGTELRRSLAPLGELVSSTRSGILPDGAACERADLGQSGSLAELIDRVRPDVVVNAAAYTAVDRAESEPELAYRINAEAVEELAHACTASGARLIHYSTDYVFSGENDRPWREDDPTGPVNTYGASKLAGEEEIRASGCQHMVFRIAWVYAAHGHNFLRTMLRLAGEREVIQVVDDQHGTPTPAHWVAEATAKVIAGGYTGSGTWHLAPQGQTTWHGFAERIFSLAREEGLLGRTPELVAVSSQAFPAAARRPSWSVLDESRARGELGISLPHWQAGLAAALSDLAGHSASKDTTERPGG